MVKGTDKVIYNVKDVFLNTLSYGTKTLRTGSENVSVTCIMSPNDFSN